jgi:hypothetical protein
MNFQHSDFEFIILDTNDYWNPKMDRKEKRAIYWECLLANFTKITDIQITQKEYENFQSNDVTIKDFSRAFRLAYTIHAELTLAFEDIDLTLEELRDFKTSKNTLNEAFKNLRVKSEAARMKMKAEIEKEEALVQAAVKKCSALVALKYISYTSVPLLTKLELKRDNPVEEQYDLAVKSSVTKLRLEVLEKIRKKEEIDISKYLFG